MSNERRTRSYAPPHLMIEHKRSFSCAPRQVEIAVIRQVDRRGPRRRGAIADRQRVATIVQLERHCRRELAGIALIAVGRHETKDDSLRVATRDSPHTRVKAERAAVQRIAVVVFFEHKLLVVATEREHAVGNAICKASHRRAKKAVRRRTIRGQRRMIQHNIDRDTATIGYAQLEQRGAKVCQQCGSRTIRELEYANVRAVVVVCQRRLERVDVER